MLKLNSEEMFLIPMPIYMDYHILTNIKSDNRHQQIIMTYLNEHEEEEIDKSGNITLHRGKRTFTINLKQIYCYGEVDFFNGSDLEQINSFNFLSHLGVIGIRIYSNYDYKLHACCSPKTRPLWSETFSPARLALYAHGCLNKPNRIVLFNMTVK